MSTLYLHSMFPVYICTQASDDSEQLVLAIDSDKAFLCQEEEGGKLKVYTGNHSIQCYAFKRPFQYNISTYIHLVIDDAL